IAWHVAHATESSVESCSSKKRIFPRTRLASVGGFSAGALGGGSGSGGSPAKAAAAASVRTAVARSAVGTAVRVIVPSPSADPHVPRRRRRTYTRLAG